MEPTRYAYVDALRGWAILGVLVVHTWNSYPLLPGPLSWLAEHGRHGVQLFYVLSALTLAMSITTRKEQNWRNYFIRRFFRIAPMFWIAMILYIAYGYFTGKNYFSPISIFVTSIFWHGYNPLWINAIVPGGWSIAVEEHFYILLPLFLLFVRNLYRAILAFIVLIPLSVILMPKVTGWLPHAASSDEIATFFYLWLPNQLPVFALGLVLFFAIPVLRQLPEETPKSTAVILAIAGIAVLYYGTQQVFYQYWHVAWSVMLACFVAAIALYPMRIFVNAPMIALGKISFSVYLLHNIVLWQVIDLVKSFTTFTKLTIPDNAEFLVIFSLLLLFCLPLCWFTYKKIESPFKDVFCKRFIAWLDRRQYLVVKTHATAIVNK